MTSQVLGSWAETGRLTGNDGPKQVADSGSSQPKEDCREAELQLRTGNQLVQPGLSDSLIMALKD